MLVEKWGDGDNFPRRRGAKASEAKGPSAYDAQLPSAEAWSVRLTKNHQVPRSVFAPNIDLNITKLAKYHGEARFNGGMVSIQEFVPMWANMKAQFVIEDSLIRLTRIDIDTDARRRVASGVVDVAHFPEMSYAVQSRLQSQREREIFFADEPWPLTGDADFNGTFHLFKGGHDLAGNFTTETFGVYDYRFPSRHTARSLDAARRSRFGTAAPSFTAAPRSSHFRPSRSADQSAERPDSTSRTRASTSPSTPTSEQSAGQRFAGRATVGGTCWNGGLASSGKDHHDDGEIVVTAPAGRRAHDRVARHRPRVADAGSLRATSGAVCPLPLPRICRSPGS